MKYWEIIADNLSKAVGVGAVSQLWTRAGERSGLLTRIAATESVSLCVLMKTDVVAGTRYVYSFLTAKAARSRTIQ